MGVGHLGWLGRRRALAPLVAAVTAMVALCLPGTAFASPVSPLSGTYVALGDSYTSGPLIPNQETDPLLCFRSTHDYPALLDQALHPAAFDDVSCSGATSVDMTQAQPLISGTVPLGHNAPQFDALNAKTTLVTLGIGGNDIDFGGIALTCLVLSSTAPSGSPCEQHFVQNGVDLLRQRIAALGPQLASVLAGIRQRAPNALVMVVGYPDILPVSGPGCYPAVPIASGDVAYLNGIEKALNLMLATETVDHGDVYVDTYHSSIGHDVCQPAGTKWIEGVIPTDPAFPIHPNELAMQNDANQAVSALEAAVSPET
ncbi:MAG TPA: SGNH/GDSL hydrolase family protein [Candidatus Dormibacteraeota bacterium]|jgi:lysophospholipase L1-like esterase|nr:SGNH/GDSL hydrolase family protein [Candidatus Dormibacteraeota bacterium]